MCLLIIWSIWKPLPEEFKETIVMRKMNNIANHQDRGMKITPIQEQYGPSDHFPTHQPEQSSAYQKDIHYILDQPPTSPKRKGPSKEVIITIVVIITIIIAISISVALYVDKPNPDKSDSNFQEGRIFEMTSVNTMKVRYNDKITGGFATLERWSIDSFWGNDDGVLNSSELRDFEESYPQTAIGSQSNGITIDNNEGEITQFSVSHDGAIGDVDSGSQLLRAMSFTILWIPMDTNNISYSVKMSVCAIPSENFKFISPPGYNISSVIGLDDVSYNDGNINLTGTIYEGTQKWVPEYIVYITITKIGFQEPTPQSNLSFSRDPATIDTYSGTFQGTINNSEVEIIVLDISLRIMVVLDLESETTLQIPGYEMNITYNDTNNDRILDPGDTLIIREGANGDEVYVVYKPTGGIIASVTLD